MDNLPRTLRASGLDPSSERIELCQRLALSAILGDDHTHHKDLISRWARAIHARTAQNKAPLRLEPILARLNAEVKLVPLSNGARLLYMKDRSTILVRNADSLGEQRFNILHECAHIVFRKAVERAISEPEIQREVFIWGSSSMHESLCDDLAGELLMPRDWLALAAPKHFHAAGLLFAHSIATEFGVSTMAILRRLIDFDFPYAVVFWKLCGRPGAEQKVRTVWRWKPKKMNLPFIPPLKALVDASPIHQVLDDRLPRSGWIDLSIIGLGARPSYLTELCWTSDGVLGLVHLSPAIEESPSLREGVTLMKDDERAPVVAELHTCRRAGFEAALKATIKSP